jgi:hypothetical protein
MTHNAFHLGILITAACFVTVLIVAGVVFLQSKWNRDTTVARSKIQTATYWKNQAEVNQDQMEYYRNRLTEIQAATTKDAE